MSIQHKVPPNLDDRGFTERRGDGVIYHDYLARWCVEPAWRQVLRTLGDWFRWSAPERRWARAARAEYARTKVR